MEGEKGYSLALQGKKNKLNNFDIKAAISGRSSLSRILRYISFSFSYSLVPRSRLHRQTSPSSDPSHAPARSSPFPTTFSRRKTNGPFDIDNRLRYETNGAQRFVIRLAASKSLQRFQRGANAEPLSIFSLKLFHVSPRHFFAPA